MFPEWTVAVGFFIGAAFGSFLNVVIYRLPRGMSLLHPPSHCPECNHRLGGLDLVPILSFLAARAKCRYCAQPVSWRYMVVELITGSVLGAFWWRELIAAEEPARFFAFAAFGTALVACIFIDLYHYIIPDSLNAWLLGIGLAFNGWLFHTGSEAAMSSFLGLALPSAVAGALTGIAVFWGIAFFGRLVFRKDAMGHGDIKLARGIGAVLFPALALISFGLAVAIGAVLGVFQILARGRGSEENEVDEAEYVEEPESIWSLLKCGLGYLLLIDVFALFFPRLEERWFGPVAEEGEDDWQPSFTTIPFGPYLAAGAILAAVFAEPLLGAVEAYWEWTTEPGQAQHHHR